jgi:hypothetical protein
LRPYSTDGKLDAPRQQELADKIMRSAPDTDNVTAVSVLAGAAGVNGRALLSFQV